MPETYRTTTSAKRALQNCLAFNARDWAAVKADAWIWGIVFGWDDEAMAEVAARHGWDAFDVENLRALHADFDRLAAQECPPASGNATDAVMQVLADEGLLAEVPLQQELRLQQRITAALAEIPLESAPPRRGERVRWEAVASYALVVHVRPRAGTTTVFVSPDYDPTTVVAVDLKELARA